MAGRSLNRTWKVFVLSNHVHDIDSRPSFVIFFFVLSWSTHIYIDQSYATALVSQHTVRHHIRSPHPTSVIFQSGSHSPTSVIFQSGPHSLFLSYSNQVTHSLFMSYSNQLPTPYFCHISFASFPWSIMHTKTWRNMANPEWDTK